jgi:uncharacterized protein (TIGR02145 family)
MKLVRFYFTLLVCAAITFSSCKKIESTNPYDVGTPKSLFTPSDFTAVLNNGVIQLKWSPKGGMIEGFKIFKSIGGSNQTLLATLPSTALTYSDTSFNLGEVNRYTLLAFAGNNESNKLMVDIIANIKVTTSSPSLVMTDSVIGGGSVSYLPGTSISTCAISWWKLSEPNSRSTLSKPFSNNAFTLTANNLSPNTQYEYQAIVIDNRGKWYYGQKKGFTTRPLAKASITTSQPLQITSRFVKIGGGLTYDGGSQIIESGIVFSSSSNPTTNNIKITNQSPDTSFLLYATGLNPNTVYYFRAYAINSQGTSYGNEVLVTTKSRTTNTGTVSDIDGNNYNIVTIGNQVWLSSNLKATKFNDGISIQNITDNIAWDNATSASYCWYNNSITNKPTHGALYNYYAIDRGKLCPAGWHIPTDFEWAELIDFLGGSAVAGGKLKQVGFALWQSPNTGASNASGFSATPSGARLGGFTWLSYSALWATSSFTYPNNLIRFSVPNVNYNSASVSFQYYLHPNTGLSVRCIGD